MYIARKILAILFFIVAVFGLVFIGSAEISITWTDQGHLVGPNESIRVSNDSEFYTKEPPAQILLKSTCNFVLINTETNETQTATFVAPQLGETQGSYLISNVTIDGSRYRAGLCGANIFSEGKVVIFVERPLLSKITETIMITLVFILLFMIAAAITSWIYDD